MHADSVGIVRGGLWGRLHRAALLDVVAYREHQRLPMRATTRRCERSVMKIRKPPPLKRDDEPQIDTPVIDMQDLEHQPSVLTRVNNTGVEVLPQINLSKEDEQARKAIEDLERTIREQPPG